MLPSFPIFPSSPRVVTFFPPLMQTHHHIFLEFRSAFFGSDPPRTLSNIVEFVFRLLKGMDFFYEEKLSANNPNLSHLFGAQSQVRYYSYGSYVSILESRIVSVRDDTKQMAIVEAFCTPVRWSTDSNLAQVDGCPNYCQSFSFSNQSSYGILAQDNSRLTLPNSYVCIVMFTVDT